MRVLDRVLWRWNVEARTKPGFEAYLWSVHGLIYRLVFSVLGIIRHPSFHLGFHACTPVRGQMRPERSPQLVSIIVEEPKGVPDQTTKA